MVGGNLTQLLQRVDLNCFPEFPHYKTMLFLVSRVVLEGSHHLEEDVHEIDYLRVVLAAPLSQGLLLLAHGLHFLQTEIGQLLDQFSHKPDEVAEIALVETQSHDDP